MSPRHVQRRELVAMLRLAWPLIVAQVAASGQGLIEVVLAGHRDAETLGAVALGANVGMVPLMMMIGTMYAVPASVAQLDGAGRRGAVAPLAVQAVWLGLALGLLALPLVRWGGPWALGLAGIPAPLAAAAGSFLRAVCWAFPAVGLFVGCRGVSDGVSMPAPTMVLSLSGLVLLLPLGYALMFGAAGLPAFGAAGVGWSATIVNWMQAGAYLAFLRWGARYRGLGWASVRRLLPDPRTLGGLLRVGVPMGLAILMEVGM
ncbi:MAG: hypothetical protein JOY70_10545, partial [Acidisphaera sp.]|nr:hypothetical protein [Acidisphaera sp.]